MKISKKQSTWRRINNAVIADKKNNPTFPDHIVAQAARVTSSAGDIINESLVLKYEKERPPDDHMIAQLESAAINTIVQAFRFIENLKNIQYKKPKD